MKTLLTLLASGLVVLALVAFVAVQVSAPLALLLAIVLGVGSVRLIHSSNPLRRRLRERDDKLFVTFCKTGVTGRIRQFYRRLPSDPRCRICLGPFRGIGRLLGIKPSRKNPNFCPG